ncbi:MAG: CHAT domain-containing protein [Cyanobacteria bacterium P01_F01_bin.150]
MISGCKKMKKNFIHDSLRQKIILINSFLLWLISATLLIPTVRAAEKITFYLGPLERSVPINDLELYATENKVSNELGFILHHVGDSQRQLLKSALLQEYPIPELISNEQNNRVKVSDFLYTSLGEKILIEVGTIIKTESNLEGFYSLRSALILATDSEGLNLLDALKKFPINTIRVDVSRLLQVMKEEKVTSPSCLISDQILKRHADQLIKEAVQLWFKGNYQELIDNLEESLAIRQDINDCTGEAITQLSLSLAHNKYREYEKAIEYGKKALESFQYMNFQSGEGLALINIAFAYYGLEDHMQALDYYNKGLKIHDENSEKPGEDLSFDILKLIVKIEGSELPLIDCIELIHKHLGKAITLGHIARSHTTLGEYQEALDYFQQELELLREVPYQPGEAKTLKSIGSTYEILRQYSTALDYHHQALEIYQETHDLAGKGETLRRLGSLYSILSQSQESLKQESFEYYEKALNLYQSLNNQDGIADTLDDLGRMHHNNGDYNKAIESHQQALDIYRKTGNRFGEGQTLDNIAKVYYNQARYDKERYGEERYDEALILLQQSLEIRRDLGNKNTEIDILIKIGDIHNQLREHDTAIDYYGKAVEKAQQIGNKNQQAKALSIAGTLTAELGDLSEAEELLYGALEILEEIRNPLESDDQISFFYDRNDTYKVLQDVLVMQGKPSEALVVSERTRAVSLKNLLEARSTERLDEKVLISNPNLADIQRIARDHQATLIEYSLIDTSISKPALYIWVVKPTGETLFRQVNLEQQQASVESLMGHVQTSLGVRSRGGFDIAPSDDSRNDSDLDRQLQKLYGLLIEPIEDLLPTDPESQLIFIPQGQLFGVPFAALKNESGQYLIEKHTVSISPAIQILDLTRKQVEAKESLGSFQSRDLLLVGNPTMPNIWISPEEPHRQLSSLPGAEQEVQEIASLFETSPLVAGKATETIVKQKMPNARIIHLATHGLLEYGNPIESGILDLPGAIALARDDGEDGLLTAAEILEELDLAAELVVLSACDTGRGNVTGDGVLGLSRSLIVSGAPSVVVSLWSVPDIPTADLMTEFYTQIKQGQDKAQALRKAMLKTMENHKSPRDWAAFILIGEA